MSKFVIIFCLMFFNSSTTNDLFEDVTFKNGKAYKNNISVLYESIGKTSMNLSSFEKDFKSNTSLSFYCNDLKYYLPISDKAFPKFLLNSNIGDTLHIDIVIFDSIYDYRGKISSQKEYYSYINKIVKN